jgi:hypothetical protein
MADKLGTLSGILEHLKWLEKRAEDMKVKYLHDELLAVAHALESLAWRVKP